MATILLCIFDICRMLNAVALVKNDVLLLVSKWNVLNLIFSNPFNKSLIKCGKIVFCLMQSPPKYGKWPETGAHSALSLNPTISKFCLSSYFYCYYCFLTLQFRNFVNLKLELLWVSNPSSFSLKIKRNYVSIIISIVGNITVLVSYIALDILCLWAMVSIRKSSSYLHHTCYLPGLSRYVCCFTRNTLSIFFCSDQIIAKKNALWM